MTWLRGGGVFVAARMLMWVEIAPRFICVGSPPNKPMQPTAKSVAVMRETCRLRGCVRGG